VGFPAPDPAIRSSAHAGVAGVPELASAGPPDRAPFAAVSGLEIFGDVFEKFNMRLAA
jgi:hypothetical protein